MSLVNNVQNLATRIGQEFKVVRTEADAIASARYTKAETDAAISAAIDDVLNGAPGALDTLNELAAALGNDANFATTIASQIAAKADAASVNSALALKANISDVYTQAQTNAAITSATSGIALSNKVLNLQAPTNPSTTAVINPALASIGTVNGYVINLSFGNFDEAGPILIDNKWQLQIEGPAAAGTTAVTVKNGLTIQNSNGVRITRVQFEGASSISSRAGLGHYFEKVQLMGNVTLGGTGGFMMFTDCEFGGNVTIAPTFAGVVYFIRCSFGNASGVYTFGQSSPMQAIVADSTGVPNAGFSKAVYSGMVSYKNNSQSFFSNGVAISTAGATSGKVLKHNGTAFVPADDAAADVTKSYVDTALALKADTSAVYTKSESDLAISSAVNDLVGAAPGTLDTLAEIAAAIEADQSGAAAMAQQIALKANSADVYTKPEVDARMVNTGDITFSGGKLIGSNGEVRLASQNVSTTATYTLTEGVDFSTAVWDGDSVTFNDTTQNLYDAIFSLNGQFDIIELTVNGSVFTVTSTGSSTPGAPSAAVLYLNEVAVGGPLNVTSIHIEARTGTESYVEIDGQDFRVDVQDDVRIYGNDTFRLVNRSTEANIRIETNDGENVWEFNADGTFILPSGGDIRDNNGNSVLGGAQINDETPSSENVYSSSKVEGMIGDVSTDFVATFEAALV